MTSYSALQVFSPAELALLARAERLVASLPDDLLGPLDPDVFGRWLRCHEVARAVGKVLGLDVVDGKHGSVAHTWLRTPVEISRKGSEYAKILDVYAVGRMPMVQIIDTHAYTGHFTRKGHYPRVGLYRDEGEPRTDIREEVLAALLRHFTVPSEGLDAPASV